MNAWPAARPVPPLHSSIKASAGSSAVLSSLPQFADEVTTLSAVVAVQAVNIFVPLMYIGLVLYSFNLPATEKLFRRLVPVGKMGLSVYVLQSLMGVFIFYGYGFGVLLKMPGTIALGVGVLIFLSLMAFSHWWFKFCKFGPLEWVWRSATKRKVQPNILRA